MDGRVRVAVERDTLVAAPPEKVWEVIADVARWPEFKSFIRSVRAPAPLGPGLKFTMKIAVKGPAVPVPVTVLEWDRPWRMAWTGGLPGLVMSTHGFDLKPEAGGTWLVSWEKFCGPLCGLMLVFVSESDLISLHDRWLAAIKARAEIRS